MARTNTYLKLNGEAEEALADGGKVTMELQDMSLGANYGALTDQSGVQWMVNCASSL
jgi:uncharacterized glyoxalase superfamily protein PhnB